MRKLLIIGAAALLGACAEAQQHSPCADHDYACWGERARYLQQLEIYRAATAPPRGSAANPYVYHVMGPGSSGGFVFVHEVD